MGDLIPRSIRKADVQDSASVALGHIDSPVNGFQDVWPDEFSLTEDLDARTVALQQLSVLGDLSELDLCHVHESVDFVFGALEVLNAKGVDCDNFDTRFVAHFEDLPSLLVLYYCL